MLLATVCANFHPRSTRLHHSTGTQNVREDRALAAPPYTGTLQGWGTEGKYYEKRDNAIVGHLGS